MNVCVCVYVCVCVSVCVCVHQGDGVAQLVRGSVKLKMLMTRGSNPWDLFLIDILLLLLLLLPRSTSLTDLKDNAFAL